MIRRWERGRRRPIALVLLRPPDLVRRQRTYPFEHDDIGRFEIFIVPLGPDREGLRYEAVFT
jgi:hypothetical protein